MLLNTATMLMVEVLPTRNHLPKKSMGFFLVAIHSRAWFFSGGRRGISILRDNTCRLVPYPFLWNTQLFLWFFESCILTTRYSNQRKGHGMSLPGPSKYAPISFK